MKENYKGGKQRDRSSERRRICQEIRKDIGERDENRGERKEVKKGEREKRQRKVRRE